MDYMEIESKIKEIITEKLGFKEGQVMNKDTFIDELGMDSMDIIDLVMEIEEEFGVVIPDESFSADGSMKSVQDLINFVIDYKAKGQL